MNREELKAHCEREVQHFERVKDIMPVTLNDWKRYEEQMICKVQNFGGKNIRRKRGKVWYNMKLMQKCI